jgi:hypothetical protein
VVDDEQGGAVEDVAEEGVDPSLAGGKTTGKGSKKKKKH